ncbi:uncharacterized protein [Physcomitrium patens]|uniref:Tetratricopeptide SHNi-TPR domain-containing protein n=1 Tax=Physcomitrium patens TaxID=3218 RepID=A0A7I4CTN9_PHYPA|nr:NASP-related protein sim3-like isoform X2 [Physcomitrium patens]|eukprot:XP_024364543.1 NASP-related protein sim3-like isoform X2 [Physcomitrella patens]
MEASSSNGATNGETSTQGSAAVDLEEAQRLFDDGCEFMHNEAFEDAAECFSKALEIRVRHFGELAPECATTYFKYGCALFDKLQEEADPLGETVNPNPALPSSHPEGSSGKEVTGKDPVEEAGGDDDGDEDDVMGEGEEGKEEEEGDLEDAWKMLEFARVIHEKLDSRTIEAVDIITKLADVNCFKENYEACYEDYAKALEMLKQIVEPDSRILAELYFKIAIAKQLDLKPKEALIYCSNAVAVCEARVQRLKHEINNVHTEGVDALGTSEAASVVDVEHSEPQTNGSMKATEHDNDEVINPPTEEKSAAESKVNEIKDIEDLLVDLKDKEQELKEMASAPTLVEQLQAANPEAAASMKQLFSLAAGSQASDSGGSSSSTADGIKTSNGFDQPTLANFTSSTAVVTDLGVVGRGIKRAEPVAVVPAGIVNSSQPSKKRSFDMLMNETGNGETQIGFGNGAVKQADKGTI